MKTFRALLRKHYAANSVVIRFDARETSPAFAAAAARGVMGRWCEFADAVKNKI